MAQHPEPCEVCSLIRQCESGAHPGLIAEMETGWAILGGSQYFRGYTMLLCKCPAPELEDLDWEFRLKFLAEVALVSEAVNRVTQPHKMNVESLGNVTPHLHWHFFPRQLSEPEPLKPVWLVMPKPEEAEQYALDAEKHGELKAAIAAALIQVRAERPL
jgi:diadenosine tetraphosphate (Ap4A) HIT family hydrolase